MKKVDRYMTGIWQRGERDQALVIIRAYDNVLVRVSLQDGNSWETNEHVISWEDIHEVA